MSKSFVHTVEILFGVEDSDGRLIIINSVVVSLP